MSLKKVLLFAALLLISNTSIHAQCFCGHARFRLVLPGLKCKNGKTNYILHTLMYKDGFDKVQFFPSEIKGDTINFSYSTGAGMDSLVFKIVHPDGKKQMALYVLNIHYDINYFIDLTTFAPGKFLFDWTKIGDCQEEQRDSILVQCGSNRFYQLKSEKEKNSYILGDFIPKNIRPFDLMQFKIE